jgi:chemotaxis protein methyltransferase CheR
VSPVFKIKHSEFVIFSKFIELNYGIKLKDEKITMVTGRLQSLMSELGLTTLTEYLKYVNNDSSGEAVITLVNKITTNHTYFMREPEHFYYFRDYILPFLKNTVKDRDLRIWCAASSSGEEPYTLAMIVDEFLGPEKQFWNTKLLATDISSRVLEIAKKGQYSADVIKVMPKMWQLKYFVKNSLDSVSVKKEIKDDVVYRKFNLMDEKFPFKKKFQVIFLRNVMIYFDEKTKKILLSKIYDSLIPGGYLFIGHSESINRESSKFKYIKPSVYRK